MFLGALSQLRLDDPPVYLSVLDASIDTSHLFFGTAESGDAPYLSMVTMLAMIAVGIAILRSRLKSAEVAS